MIVVDASVAVRGLLFEGEAAALLRAERLHAPHLIDSEVVHAFRRLERQSKITSAEVALALHKWSEMGVRRYSVARLLLKIWDLRKNLTAYDASYAALADTLECTLATMDRAFAGVPGMRRSVLTVRS